MRTATGSSRIHTLINTHWHPEQTGANEAVGRAGGVIFAHEKTQHVPEQHRLLGDVRRAAVPPLPEAARPNRTTRGDGSMEFAGQQIDYGYLPAAHTDGDLFVHFPQLNLLVGRRRRVRGGVAAARLSQRRLARRPRARARAARAISSQPDTRVVPADGRVMTGSDIVRQRDIYRQLFVTMIDYLNMGFGPEDAVEREPAQGVRGRVRRRRPRSSTARCAAC